MSSVLNSCFAVRDGADLRPNRACSASSVVYTG